MLLRRIIARSLVQTGVFAALLFGPAGTLRWPRAWIFPMRSLLVSVSPSTIAAERRRRKSKACGGGLLR